MPYICAVAQQPMPGRVSRFVFYVPVVAQFCQIMVDPNGRKIPVVHPQRAKAVMIELFRDLKLSAAPCEYTFTQLREQQNPPNGVCVQVESVPIEAIPAQGHTSAAAPQQQALRTQDGREVALDGIETDVDGGDIFGAAADDHTVSDITVDNMERKRTI
jgi:hypothetical protein